MPLRGIVDHIWRRGPDSNAYGTVMTQWLHAVTECEREKVNAFPNKQGAIFLDPLLTWLHSYERLLQREAVMESIKF